MNQWEMLVEFAHHAEIDCFLLAGRYTLMEQKALPLLDLCWEKGISIFLGGVYNTGILARGRFPAHGTTISLRLLKFWSACCGSNPSAPRYGVSLQADALQFPLAHAIQVKQ